MRYFPSMLVYLLGLSLLRHCLGILRGYRNTHIHTDIDTHRETAHTIKLRKRNHNFKKQWGRDAWKGKKGVNDIIRFLFQNVFHLFVFLKQG